MGQGLNPPAPDLAGSADRMGPGELFWVTKHGIKMTGMPAWGETHDDDALWPVVAFMTLLPELDGAEYEGLLGSAAGSGHHAAGDESGDHDHGEPAVDGSDRDAAPSGPTHEHGADDHHH